jgi:hypothetical protein
MQGIFFFTRPCDHGMQQPTTVGSGLIGGVPFEKVPIYPRPTWGSRRDAGAVVLWSRGTDARRWEVESTELCTIVVDANPNHHQPWL